MFRTKKPQVRPMLPRPVLPDIREEYINPQVVNDRIKEPPKEKKKSKYYQVDSDSEDIIENALSAYSSKK